jgi:hypothetical protein
VAGVLAADRFEFGIEGGPAGGVVFEGDLGDVAPPGLVAAVLLEAAAGVASDADVQQGSGGVVEAVERGGRHHTPLVGDQAMSTNLE